MALEKRRKENLHGRRKNENNVTNNRSCPEAGKSY